MKKSQLALLLIGIAAAAVAFYLDALFVGILIVIATGFIVAQYQNPLADLAQLSLGVLTIAAVALRVYTLFAKEFSWLSLILSVFLLLLGLAWTIDGALKLWKTPGKCPKCGVRMRTPEAQQCMKCGFSWRASADVEKSPASDPLDEHIQRE